MNTSDQTLDPESEAALSARRRDATRLVLHRHRVLDCLSLNAQPWLRNSVLAGLQAALGATIILPLVYYHSPWPHLTGYAALGALVALFGRFAPLAARRRRIVFLCGLTQVAGVAAMSLLVWFGAPQSFQLMLLAFMSGLFFLASLNGRFGPPGALIFIFAAGAAMAPVDSGLAILERSGAVAAGAVLAWLICAVTEEFRDTGKPDAPLPGENLPLVRERLAAAARIVLGSAIAGFAVVWAGAGHPTWAVMGTVVVLQGVNLHTNVTRALQRMAGTLVGAGIVWLVLSQEPPFWSVIALVAVFQVVTEFVIGANYALGQIFVTPMALLMTYLAAQGAVGPSMAPERVFDTVTGAVIGIAIAVLFSTRDDRQQFARHHAARGTSAD